MKNGSHKHLHIETGKIDTLNTKCLTNRPMSIEDREKIRKAYLILRENHSDWETLRILHKIGFSYSGLRAWIKPVRKHDPPKYTVDQG